jgi:hypothetical protein
MNNFIEACKVTSDLPTLINLYEINKNSIDITTKYIDKINIHDYKSTNIYKLTLFMLTCKYNTNLHVVKWVWNISKNKISDKDYEGNTAFMLACKYNTNLEVVKWIWDISKTINIISYMNLSISYMNVNSMNLTIHGADINKENLSSAFWLACKSNTNLEVIKWILSICNDIKISKINKNIFTHTCSFNTNLEIVKWIWNFHKDKINIDKNNYNITSIIGVSRNSNLEVVKWVWDIIKDTIDIDGIIMDLSFRNACFVNTNLDVIKWIWNKNWNNINYYFIPACLNFYINIDIVKWMYEMSEFKLNINYKNRDGNTAYMLLNKYNKNYIYDKMLKYLEILTILNKRIYNNECYVCFDDNNMILLTCGHAICSSCIENSIDDKCCICRQTYTLQNCFMLKNIK